MDAYSGTMPMASSHAFDIGGLDRHLTATLPGYQGPLQVEQFRGGQSNPTYLLRTPTRTYVMRTKPGPVAKLLPSAHAVEREFRVMSALHPAGVPVPRMHLLCEDEAVIGRAFYVMEHVQGRVLWEQALPDSTPEHRGAIFDELNRVLALLHSVDPISAGLADYGRPGNYFERQIARWSKQYQASVTEPIAAMDALQQWLPQHLPALARDERFVSVVHGDYRLDNVMMHPSQDRILAILDWELSTLGHPLADFSYHCLGWHIQPGVFRGLAGLDLQALGIPDEASYVARYCERFNHHRAAQGSPVRLDPQVVMADWPYYISFNCFRLAAIFQGIAKRAEQGIASNERARATGASARPMAELGWKLAQTHRP